MESKKIKVYLQYPWKFPDSPYYKYMIEDCPDGIYYLNTQRQGGAITNRNKFLLSNNLKICIRKFIKSLHLPIINSHKSPNGNHDLIHCAHCLSKNKDTPWVADFEALWQFYVEEKSRSTRNKIKKLIYSKNCKKIMPWTEKAKKDILNEFPRIEKKIELVSPSIKLNANFVSKKSNKITILYATRYFWLKGGILALEVYKKLHKKYGNKIDLIFISDVPEKIKSRYPEFKILDLVSSDKMKELYEKSDIYFYPSMQDTFGFGLLEAMSYGLPIVTLNTINTPTRKEIVENNKHCLSFDVDEEVSARIKRKKEDLVIGREEHDIINKLFKNTCRLIDNNSLRNKISKTCIREIQGGKFSTKIRNEKLERIYREALND